MLFPVYVKENSCLCGNGPFGSFLREFWHGRCNVYLHRQTWTWVKVC